MKLFITWTRKLSIGMAWIGLSCSAYGQGGSYPNPMGIGSFQGPPGYPTSMQGPPGYPPAIQAPPGYPSMMGYAPPCDASCDEFNPGMGEGWFGQGGCACADCANATSGCGPLGCNGGTFGDGRSLHDLCSALTSRLCSVSCAIITPYGEGGVAAQRWFDFSAEATYFSREKGAGLMYLTSQGRAPSSPADYVLSTDNVDLDDYQLGLALQGNIQVGPGSNIEVIYFGLNEWDESATATSSTPTLYSFFSDFGTNPFDGFDDSDRSFEQSISYESQFNNGEVNLRRRWAEPSGFLQGSFLAGIRYFQLDEQSVFSAFGENNNAAANNGLRFFNYDTQTQNQMTGFQIGGDLWLNVIPGVKVGTELKGGVYGNHATQDTRIFANSLPGFGIDAIEERASDGRTAYLVQWSTQAIYRLTYACALKGSYQLIYVDNVALAPENINDEPPALFLPNSTRVISINTDGEILYTGFTGGLEYTW